MFFFLIDDTAEREEKINSNEPARARRIPHML